MRVVIIGSGRVTVEGAEEVPAGYLIGGGGGAVVGVHGCVVGGGCWLLAAVAVEFDGEVAILLALAMFALQNMEEAARSTKSSAK